MTGVIKPLVLLLDEMELSHRLSARFDPDKTALIRRETISRRRVPPLVPVYDTIIDEQARFTDRELLAAIEAVTRPLQPRLQFLGIPIAYHEDVRSLRARNGSKLHIAVTHAFQGQLHAFFYHCYAALQKTA